MTCARSASGRSCAPGGDEACAGDPLPPPPPLRIGAAPATGQASLPPQLQAAGPPFPQAHAAAVCEGKSGAACPVTASPCLSLHPEGVSPLCLMFSMRVQWSLWRNLQVMSPPLSVALSSALPANPSPPLGAPTFLRLQGHWLPCSFSAWMGPRENAVL